MRGRKADNPHGVKIFDSELSRYVDAFLFLLSMEGEETLLPEIYEIFGSELTTKFLDLFGGATIRVPSREDMERKLRDFSIFVNVTTGKSTPEDEATAHELHPHKINAIVKEMGDKMGAMGLRLVQNG